MIKKLISVVAPMYNEEGLVHQYCAEMIEMINKTHNDYDFEIILVNDGSSDNTYNLMLEEQKSRPDILTTICLSRNFGLEGAVNAGLRKAKGDAIVVMDADLQDPPALIPKMIQKWESGADVVVGSRIKRSNDNFFKKLGAAIYYKVLNVLSGKLKLEKSAANFRLLSRQALDQLLDMPEVNSIFRVVVPFIGMKTDIVEYDRDKRFAGKTKYNLKSMIPYALDSITGISIQPLRLIRKLLYINVFVFLLSVFGMIFADEWRFLFVNVFINNLFVFIILIALSIMAEYIAQIMYEVKGRPTSIIYKYNPSLNAKERK